jgi:hypothetical protein
MCCSPRQESEESRLQNRKDTLCVDSGRGAIFFKLSQTELSDIKKGYETEEDFYVTADGIAEDKYRLRTFLEKHDIPIIYADTTVKVVRLGNCDINIVDTSVVKTIWTNVILYERGKKHIVLQDADVGIIRRYFNLDEESELEGTSARYVKSSKWFGDYNYYISDTTVAVSLFVEYTLSVSADRCVFSGNGHMTCFEIECRIKDEADNSLVFDFAKSLSADEPMPSIDGSTSPLVSLYYEKGKYYLKSKFIADTEGNYNTKTECKKTK